jgi:hypothetical protein
MKRLALLLLATSFATASFCQSNPCDDPLYLRLAERDLDSLSDREFSVFQDKSEACTEFLQTHGSRTVEADAAIPDSLRPRFRTKGVSFRVHLNGTSWYVDDSRFFDDQTRGGGLGFGVSWGVSELITLVFNVDAAGMNPDFGKDYTLSHGDLGVRFTFASDARKLRPFAQTSLTGFGTEREYRQITRQNLAGTFQVVGGGLALGGGIMYFFNPKLALDVGVDFMFGEISEVKFRNVSIDQSTGSYSTRLNAGIAWYPWH